MKGLRRNKQTFYYRLYSESVPVIDSDGFETGEKTVGYTDPVEMKANISPAAGEASVQLFGSYADYDKIISTCEMDCPIDEHSVLFVDTMPDIEEGKLKNAHDYIVKKVAKSLNSISIAIQKVKVHGN